METQVLSAVKVLLGEEHREEIEEGWMGCNSLGTVLVQHECPGSKPQHCISAHLRSQHSGGGGGGGGETNRSGIEDHSQLQSKSEDTLEYMDLVSRKNNKKLKEKMKPRRYNK